MDKKYVVLDCLRCKHTGFFYFYADIIDGNANGKVILLVLAMAKDVDKSFTQGFCRNLQMFFSYKPYITVGFAVRRKENPKLQWMIFALSDQKIPQEKGWRPNPTFLYNTILYWTCLHNNSISASNENIYSFSVFQ